MARKGKPLLSSTANRIRYRSSVHEVTSVHFTGTAVAKFARFDWEIGYIEKETAVYEMLEGKGLTPGFLAHLSEEGRIIGFVVEKVLTHPLISCLRRS